MRPRQRLAAGGADRRGLSPGPAARPHSGPVRIP